MVTICYTELKLGLKWLANSPYVPPEEKNLENFSLLAKKWWGLDKPPPASPTEFRRRIY